MTVPLRSSEKHFSKVHDFMKRFLTTRFFIKVKFERTTRLKLQKKKKKKNKSNSEHFEDEKFKNKYSK